MTNAKQALSKASNKKPQKNNTNTMISILDSAVMKEQFKKALPKYMTTDRFVRMAITAINSNPLIAEGSQSSVFAAMMNSAQLGLEFNTPLGEAYLIPYENKKKGIVEINFQVGYQGLLKLAYNTGQFKRITAREVKANEEFEINYGTGEISHKPCLTGEGGDVIGYYAIYQTKDGGQDVFYMSKEDARAYGLRYSIPFSQFNKGPWVDNFDAMAKKSALIQVLKYAPRATESDKLIQATSVDNANINDYKQHDDGTIQFDINYEVIDDEPKEVPKNVDIKTGEIVEDDFFEDDFVPVTDNE